MAYQNRVPKTFCTTREAAEILGVSLRTAQLWTESGLLKAWKTDGGHRRISRESIENLLVVPSRRAAVKTGKSYKPAARVGEARPFSILVVSEGRDQSQRFEAALARWPMRPLVTVVADSCEALIRIGLQRPDMVVIELQVLDSSSLHMIQSLRTVPELAPMRVVVVSDPVAGDLCDQATIPAGIPVLPKPIAFDQLYGIAEQATLART